MASVAKLAKQSQQGTYHTKWQMPEMDLPLELKKNAVVELFQIVVHVMKKYIFDPVQECRSAVCF